MGRIGHPGDLQSLLVLSVLHLNMSYCIILRFGQTLIGYVNFPYSGLSYSWLSCLVFLNRYCPWQSICLPLNGSCKTFSMSHIEWYHNLNFRWRPMVTVLASIKSWSVTCIRPISGWQCIDARLQKPSKGIFKITTSSHKVWPVNKDLIDHSDSPASWEVTTCKGKIDKNAAWDSRTSNI